VVAGAAAAYTRVVLQVLPLPPRRSRVPAKAGARSAAARAERAFERFATVACRPLLETTERQRPGLALLARRLAVRGYDAILRLHAALEVVDPEGGPACDAISGASDHTADTIEKARAIFASDYAECLGLALRTLDRARSRLLRARAQLDARLESRPELAERIELVLRWLSVVVFAVLWFLEEPEPWMQRGAAEEACFLAKEWALDYAASVDELLAPSPRPREARVADLTPEDATFDRDFADWATRVVGEAFRF